MTRADCPSLRGGPCTCPGPGCHDADEVEAIYVGDDGPEVHRNEEEARRWERELARDDVARRDP